MKQFAVFYNKRGRVRVRTITAKSAEDGWDLAVTWARSFGYDVTYLEMLEIK